MAEERVQRKLAAILAADVVGFSRMMGEDEAGTLAQLKTLRRELFEPKTAQFGGRIFKNTGDGALAEFGSANDAVQCAVEIQRALVRRNADVPEDRRIILRIGISLGDVMVDGDDLYGNGVNVAARMETLAEPGAICISGNVHEHVVNSLDVVFEDLGEQTVKNIDRPVRSYRISFESGGANRNLAPKADDPPLLPDKPSIAVLPFDNMSGDPEQEYFSDGITEDIITALSRIRQLFVIARNTTFTYKGQSVDVHGVAKDLGVRYVLEGSVRRSGDRVRITAQLIDGTTGNHLWAERYDRDLEDIFAVQDDITQIVAGAIEPEINKAEFERARRTPPGNLDAWSMYQQGMYYFHRGTDDDDEMAEGLFRQAIAKDAGFSAAHASLARKFSRTANRRLSQDFEAEFQKAISEARVAVSSDREDPYAHTALGFALNLSAVNEAVASFEHALSLNPNSALAHFGLGRFYALSGEPEKGKQHLEIGLRLSPRDPQVGIWHGHIGIACFVAGDYAGAIEWISKGDRDFPVSDQNLAVRIAALAHLGRDEEMRRECDELLAHVPHLTLSHVHRMHPGLGDALVDGLRKAGLPE